MDNLSNNVKTMILDGRVAQKDGKFKVRDRLALWNENANKIFDDDLDRLKTVILSVFQSEDPSLDLAKHQRAFANILGKGSPYSTEIRQGLAETLALLGNYSDVLINCSSRKRDNIAAEVIREIFQNMTWKRWASLSPYLTLFAESAPDAYLSAIEQFIQHAEELAQLQNEEGDIFSGGHYFTGIAQSLEVLAWEEQYFGRAVKLLAQLAQRDKGGNFYPRPLSSLIHILLPWYPQTLATSAKRIAIARVLIATTPDIGWNVISELLLNKHRVSSGTHFPKWRNVLPRDFENLPSKSPNLKEITQYESILLDDAQHNLIHLEKLINILEDLTLPSFGKALAILHNDQLKNIPDTQKEIFWSKLLQLTIKHRRHHDAAWAWDEEKILKVESVCESLRPQEILVKYKYLFDIEPSCLFLSSDYNKERNYIEMAQKAAIEEIYTTGKLVAILAFIRNIAKPQVGGYFLAPFGSLKLDDEIIALLREGKNNNVSLFLDGYLKKRFRDVGDEWLDRFLNVTWELEDKVSFLCHLPFTAKVWHFAAVFLGEQECLYWQNVPVLEWGNSPESKFAIAQSLHYNRPELAIHCLFDTYFDKNPIDFDQCAQALLDILQSEAMKRVDKWQITQLIKFMQEQKRTQEQTTQLQQIEFAYLPLLETSRGDVLPITLENALSTEPNFFHEALCTVYKSEKDATESHLSEDTKRLAFQVDSLLDNWRIVPGVWEGKFEISIFEKWYSNVIALCESSGHTNMAKFIIGGILTFAPQDSDGLWINRDLATILNAPDNDRMRNGFYNRSYNTRGAHIIDMTGQEDQKLAEQFHQKASDLENAGLWLFSETLRDLAHQYERESKRNIDFGKNQDF